MAPEQAAADPHIEHRVDLYAWGVMAYECLTGSHPFGDRQTGHEMIKAHLIEEPRPIHERAAGIPAALGELVMQCLAKDPVQRPARAEWLVEILDGALATVSGVQSAASITASRPARVTYSPDAKPPAIAVLPFANMSADAEAEFFSDGMAEEILNALTKLSGLRVVARTSSFAFKGKNVDIREIGQQLGVGFVLEGSVRKGGSKLRITAQLIDAVTGHHLWSERYDRDMSDVFAVQDEITAAIRDALSERLLGIGKIATQAAPAIDPETYEMYLRGRHLIRRRSQGMIEGLAMMKEVIARAPDYAPAYVDLGFGESMLIWYSAQLPEHGWPKVRAAAERAIALDPSLGIAYHVLGGVALWYEWDWAKAKALFDTGIAISPNEPESYSHVVWWALADGTDAEALAAGERCVAMDPLNPSIAVNLIHAYYLCRQFEAANAACDKILQLVPDYADVLRLKARTLLMMGQPDAALPCAELAVRLTRRHVWPLMDLFGILVALGRTDEYRAIRDELHRRAEHEVILPLAFAFVDSVDTERNPDAFFAWMDKAVAGRNFWVIMLHREPSYDVVRSDPRFEELLRRIGLRTRPLLA
jgi:serine/threonine-protein kinase